MTPEKSDVKRETGTVNKVEQSFSVSGPGLRDNIISQEPLEQLSSIVMEAGSIFPEAYAERLRGRNEPIEMGPPIAMGPGPTEFLIGMPKGYGCSNY